MTELEEAFEKFEASDANSLKVVIKDLEKVRLEKLRDLRSKAHEIATARNEKELEEAQKKLKELDTTHTFWQAQRDTLKAQIKVYEFELKFVELEQILETKI